MSKLGSRHWLFAAIFFVFTANLYAKEADLPNTVTELRVELDRVNIDLKEEAKTDRLKKLVSHANTLSEKNPDNAGYAMMAGFINLQYASDTGGLGALKYAKAGRDHLQKSVDLDPNIFGAAATAVLGRLYTSVPGWPIAFGNNKKGVKYLQKAIEISPNTMDSNFTYAAYLYDNKEYSEAKKYFKKAKQAPARKNRERTDELLHKTIDKLLQELDEKTQTS